MFHSMKITMSFIVFAASQRELEFNIFAKIEAGSGADVKIQESKRWALPPNSSTKFFHDSLKSYKYTYL